MTKSGIINKRGRGYISDALPAVWDATKTFKPKQGGDLNKKKRKPKIETENDFRVATTRRRWVYGGWVKRTLRLC